MSHGRVLIVVCLATLGLPPDGFAQESPTERPTVEVATLRDGQHPTIDGRVDEDLWNNARPFTAFIQQEPDEGLPASERTEIRFLADKTTLYIGVIAFDREPARIIVSQSRRDADLN